MNSRSRARRSSLGFSLGNAYGSGLSTSYGTGLGTTTSGYGSYSSGNSFSPSSYSGYLSRGVTSYTTPASSSSYPISKDYTSSASTRYSSTTSSYTSPIITSSKRYTGSKTDSELTSALVSDRSGGWRSKSIESSSNGYRDRSLSREPGAMEFAYRNMAGRDKSLARDHGRDSSLARDFTPSRDYSRGLSVGPDSTPLPPPRSKHQYQPSNIKIPAYDSASRFSNATQSLYNSRPMSRSNSFHDLREALASPTTPKARARHQTLAFGVSELDLERAKSTVTMPHRLCGSISDLRGVPSWQGSNRDLRTSNPTTSAMSNGFSKSTLDLGYNSQPGSRRESINVPTSSSQATNDKYKRSTNQNGDIDYKKLWEESQTENTRLRLEMSTIRNDLDSAKNQLEMQIQASTKNAVSDAEKREKKMLEKKLTEMEEELKLLQKLKAENEKLKSENRALTRVVSKLTAAATKPGGAVVSARK